MGQVDISVGKLMAGLGLIGALLGLMAWAESGFKWKFDQEADLAVGPVIDAAQDEQIRELQDEVIKSRVYFEEAWKAKEQEQVQLRSRAARAPE